MKTYNEINDRIAAGKAVVLTADEIIDYVDRKGLDAAAEEVDVVTTATFGPMCSSGCFLNFGHSKPKIRITEAWIQDVPTYAGIAAVDLYLGATQIPRHDPANAYYPGEFRYGGGHVIEDLIAGKELQLIAHSYGTDEYPRRELRTWFTIEDLNQAIMVNPRNCYQNYNVAVNASDRVIHTYMGRLAPDFGNMTYCSAGQLSPLLNDPWYRTIGVGTPVWLAGARGHVYAEGTQHAPICERSEAGVPAEGAGTLALTADMKEMNARYIRGVSLIGYGVSLAVGVGIAIPILDAELLRQTTIRDRDIAAPVIDYAQDYPERESRVLARVTYEQLKSGRVDVLGRKIPVGSLSSYAMALEIAELLKADVARGAFHVAPPLQPLSRDRAFRPLEIRENPR